MTQGNSGIPMITGYNVDTINERTSGAGVTVDGLLIKDGAIGVYTDYSPTVSGGFSSTTVNKASYLKIGKLVVFSFYIDGTSNADDFTFSIPFPAKTYDGEKARYQYFPVSYIKDNSSTYDSGNIYVTGGSVAIVRRRGFVAWTTSGSKASQGTITYVAE